LDNFDSGIENFGIVNNDIFNEMLFFLSLNNIKIKNNKVVISSFNKLSIALLAICFVA